MTKIVAFHSFRRGTGRTSILASVAVLLARQGKRVGVIDTNLQSPSIHLLFKMRDKDIHHTLDNYLWGECSIEQTIYDVGMEIGLEEGKLNLIPSSDNMARIMRVIKEGIKVDVLVEGFSKFSKQRALDYLFLDAGSGITEDILLSMSVADILVIVMRLDEQDYQGVGMTMELAKRLDLARNMIVVNQVGSSFTLEEVKTKIKQTFQCEVGAVLPHSEDFLNLASEDVFVLKFPEHPQTLLLKEFAAKL